jgi:hypothetical protein
VPGHAFCGAIMGYYVGQVRFGDPAKRGANLFGALFWPILLHGIYDFPILSLRNVETSAEGSPPALSLVLMLVVPAVLIVEWIWAVRLTRRLRRLQLSELAAAAEARTDAAVVAITADRDAASGPTALPAPVRGPRPGTAGSVVLIVLGSLLASLGGLIVLGIGLGWLLEGVEPDEVGSLIAGAVVLGVLPLAGGLVLFVLGLKRMRAASAG